MILVMGVGRSGTSTVARILHTRLGVCMGHHPYLERPSKGQPIGSYEDLEMNYATKDLLAGNISVANWTTLFKNQHRLEDCKEPFIGCKVTHLAALNPKQLEGINPRLVIRTLRPKELTVASLEKYRDRKVDWAKFYDEREASMMRLQLETNVPFFTIGFFDRVREDDDIEEQLKECLEVWK